MDDRGAPEQAWHKMKQTAAAASADIRANLTRAEVRPAIAAVKAIVAAATAEVAAVRDTVRHYVGMGRLDAAAASYEVATARIRAATAAIAAIETIETGPAVTIDGVAGKGATIFEEPNAAVEVAAAALGHVPAAAPATRFCSDECGARARKLSREATPVSSPLSAQKPLRHSASQPLPANPLETNR